MIETEGRVTVAAERWVIVSIPEVPGPAYIVSAGHEGDSSSDIIVYGHAVVHVAEGERYQRAQLMAAAPQLEAALEAALLDLEQGPPYHEPAIAAMRAALAAARGEATDV